MGSRWSCQKTNSKLQKFRANIDSCVCLCGQCDAAGKDNSKSTTYLNVWNQVLEKHEML